MNTHRFRKLLYSCPAVYLTILLVLPAVPAHAAPLPEGVKPAQSEPAASILVETISAGYYHTCAVKSNGRLACWGDNAFGQSSPPGETFLQISAAAVHTCGVKSDGTVACWGSDEFNQSTPPAGIFIQVSTGHFHTCGVKSDRTIACWGDNIYGQSDAPAGTYSQVSSGLYHNCAIKSDGTLGCWGKNDYNQSIPPAGTFTQVSAGGYHTCGVKSDGTLACWGSNLYGQSSSPSGSFTQVSAGGYHTCALKTDGTIVCWGSSGFGENFQVSGTFTQISAGGWHNCALKNDGALVCAGRNDDGQTSVLPGLYGHRQIEAGTSHTCERKGDGTLACWGSNSSGQSAPPSGSFLQVSAGGNHTCGVRTDGTLACWGDKSGGASTPPAGTFIQVGAGWWHTCGVKSDGTLACWGTNSDGQSSPPAGTFIQVSGGEFHSCGVKSNGTPACWGRDLEDESTPPAGTFTQVSAGGFHTCGIKNDGTAVCWGDDSYDQSSPPTGTFIQVSAGLFHTCALKTDGTLACWGNNGQGQSTPPSGTYNQVNAGDSHTCGVKSDGMIVCWGYNTSHQSEPPVTISGNVGAAGTVLSYTDSGSKTVTSDSGGSYAIEVPHNWSGTVTASRSGYTFFPASYVYDHLATDQSDQDYSATGWPSWYGGVTINSDRNVVAVGRPHIGAQVMTYSSFDSGAKTLYVPMLFKQAWGSYDSALYIQNVDSVNTATISIQFYDTDGNLSCTKPDTLPALASHGYWLPGESCLPESWYGSALVISNHDLVAVGRPHIGGEVTTYSGFTAPSTTFYLPMLFKNIWGYDSAFYIQDVNPINAANITIQFYNTEGELSYTMTDTIQPHASHGYWLPNITGLPSSWVGGVVVTSDYSVVAVGRPHLGSSVTTYNGFASGSNTAYLPTLFKQAFDGAYNSALYVQNVDSSNAASISLKFYDTEGSLTYTLEDSIPALASQGYWLPSISGLPSSWLGSVKVDSDHDVVAIGRLHINGDVSTYGGFTAGNTITNVPMLFKQMWGSYDSAVYVQNLDPSNAADVTLRFYDVGGSLSCLLTGSIPAMATQGYWLPNLPCAP